MIQRKEKKTIDMTKQQNKTNKTKEANLHNFVRKLRFKNIYHKQNEKQNKYKTIYRKSLICMYVCNRTLRNKSAAPSDMRNCTFRTPKSHVILNRKRSLSCCNILFVNNPMCHALCNPSHVRIAKITVRAYSSP